VRRSEVCSVSAALVELRETQTNAETRKKPARGGGGGGGGGRLHNAAVVRASFIVPAGRYDDYAPSIEARGARLESGKGLQTRPVRSTAAVRVTDRASIDAASKIGWGPHGEPLWGPSGLV